MFFERERKKYLIAPALIFIFVVLFWNVSIFVALCPTHEEAKRISTEFELVI